MFVFKSFSNFKSDQMFTKKLPKGYNLKHHNHTFNFILMDIRAHFRLSVTVDIQKSLWKEPCAQMCG